MEGQLSPPILVGQAINPICNSLTPLFKCGNLSTKRTWVTSCISFPTHVSTSQHGFDAKTLQITLLKCEFTCSWPYVHLGLHSPAFDIVCYMPRIWKVPSLYLKYKFCAWRGPDRLQIPQPITNKVREFAFVQEEQHENCFILKRNILKRMQTFFFS